MSKGLQIAIGVVSVIALLGWAASDALQEGAGGFVYYQTLGEFSASDVTGRARVHGYVVAGSIVRDVPARQVRFRLQESPAQAAQGNAPTTTAGRARHLPVVYAGLETPDLFRDGAEVVVEGQRRAPGGDFLASNVLAKCPSKFEAAGSESASR